MSRRDPQSSRAASGGGPGASSEARSQAGAGVPAQLRRFIERHFVSAAHVEALLLLRAAAERSWTAAELSRELRIDADQAADILSRCQRSGLVRRLEGRVRYGPRSAAAAEAVDGLARLYPAYRLAVISIIYARATAPIRDFSDAFLLRPWERQGHPGSETD